MMIRRRSLPRGWYPESREEVEENIGRWERETADASPERGSAGIAPHAGWFFSGRLAWRVVSRLVPAGTVVLLGGHRSRRDPPTCWEEDAFETPCGLLEADGPLRDRLARETGAVPDGSPDNTVEVLLPLVKAAFPDARAVCLRVPPSPAAERLGMVLAEQAAGGASIAVLASTDLTHYGPNYGFAPRGSGKAAEEWVRTVNDRDFLEAAVRKEARRMVELGRDGKAACSAGAAAAAAVFASARGLEGRLLEYATSLDRQPSTSFVGYGAVLYV